MWFVGSEKPCIYSVPNRKQSYEIGTTQVSRSLTKDGKTLNVKCTIANSKTTISFNEHHATPDADQLEITPEMMQTFLQQTDEIVRKFGYGIDGE